MVNWKENKTLAINNAMKSSAEEAHKEGASGNEIRKTQLSLENFNIPSGFIYDELTPESHKSSTIIGPFRFGPSVQPIDIQEVRNISSENIIRKSSGVLIDNGIGKQKAKLSFIFQGIQDINTYVRGLVVLFKTNPITSISNEMLTDTWSPKVSEFLKEINVSLSKIASKKIIDQKSVNKLNEKLTKGIISGDIQYGQVYSIIEESVKSSNPDITNLLNEIKNSLNFYRVASKYVPVALENLTIQSIPELPNAVRVVLDVVHIDVSGITESGYIEYLTKTGSKTVHPDKAYWLKKWLITLLEFPSYIKFFPKLTENDFHEVKIKFNQKNVSQFLDLSLVPEDIDLNKGSRPIAIAGSISNLFGLQRIIGKKLPMAQHIGVTNRYITLEVQTTSTDTLYRELSVFKEVSDEIIRSSDPFERLFGWEVVNPISKILGLSKTETDSPPSGVYALLNFNSSAGEIPNNKSVAISLAETSITIPTENPLILSNEVIDRRSLKNYYDKIVALQQSRRISKNSTEAKELFGFLLFYGSHTNIDKSKRVGLLNRDTIRASLMGKKIGKELGLLTALLKSPLISEMYTVKGGGAKTDFIESQLSVDTPFIPFFIDQFGSIDTSNNEEWANQIGALSEWYDINYKSIFTGKLLDSFNSTIKTYFVNMFAGEHTFADKLIDLIKSQEPKNLDFTDLLYNSIFNAIIKRKKPPLAFRRTYKEFGQEHSFLALYNAYKFDEDILNQEEDESIILTKNGSLISSKKRKVEDCYPDLFLPSYYELFGKDWKKYAPTLDNVGKSYIAYKNSGKIKKVNTLENKSRQDLIAVTKDTIVAPFIFFHRLSIKSQLHNASSKEKNMLGIGETHYLSVNIIPELVNLDTFKSEGAKDELLKIIENPTKVKDSRVLKTIDSMIDNYKDSSRLLKTLDFDNEIEFIESKLENPSKADYKKFYARYLAPNSPDRINIYFTATGSDIDQNTGNITSKVQLTGLQAGAFFARLHSNRFTIKEKGSPYKLSPMSDQSLSTNQSDPKLNMIRGHKEHTKAVIKETINNIKDDRNNLTSLWPTIKVYLIESRGNDLIHEDIMISSYSILKVDVVLDKDDASTAVIEIGDPLRILQTTNMYFSNVVSTGSPGNKDFFVLGPSKELYQSFTEKKKIRQGRRILIKMGYENDPDLLDTVFTGRITEVEFGDKLRIIAQGWKAELINRQVNFYTDTTKSWGSKDLAVQAIQQSDPQEGLGTAFSQADTDFFLSKLDQLDSSVIDQVLNNQTNQETPRGSYSIVDSLIRKVWFSDIFYNPTKSNIGLDTRLKNIWYPDISKTINNFLYWRNFLGTLPDFVNDYWLVPIQPAWNVLQEAARHTWHYIVQVVPYDSEATIFFGHPDQFYYYTRGDRKILSEWNKIKRAKSKDIQPSIDAIWSKFRTKFRPFTKEKKVNFSFLDGLNSPDSRFIDFGTERTLLDKASEIVGIDVVTILLHKLADINITESRQLDKLVKEVNSFIDTFISQNPFGPLFDNKVKTYNTSMITSVETTTGLISKNIVSVIDLLISIVKKISLNKEIDRVVINNIINNVEKLFSIVQDSKLYKNSYSLVDNWKLHELKKVSENMYTYDLILKIKNPLYSSIIPKSFIDVLTKFKEYILPIIGNNSKSVVIGDYIIFPGSVGNFVKNQPIEFLVLLTKFTKFIIDNTKDISTEITVLHDNITAIEAMQIAPGMKPFRDYHIVSSDQDIIENNITATTAEMWNTVVINHPATDPADTTASSGDALNTGTRIKSDTTWVYWPKPELSRVVGLQYNPGITLANKKIKVCTELNCHTKPLAAKLACNALAEGVRYMYRGNILIRGRAIKPHDRMYLNDKYNNIKGVVEVESVVHSFSPEFGWTTNIIPGAVSESNPNASLVQNAIMEQTFDFVMNITDKIFDAIAVITIVTGVGPIAAQLAKKGITTTINKVASSGLIKGLLASTGLGIKTAAVGAFNNLATKQARSFIVEKTIEKVIPKASFLLKSYVWTEFANDIIYNVGSVIISNAWVDSANSAQQLPVILAPIKQAGIPLTAGLEAEDSLFAISLFGDWYSLRDWYTEIHDSFFKSYLIK
jgi:hypothetical protein